MECLLQPNTRHLRQLSTDDIKQQQKAAITSIISYLKYLAFRTWNSWLVKDDNEGNYLQLLKLHCADAKGLRGWISRDGNWLPWHIGRNVTDYGTRYPAKDCWWNKKTILSHIVDKTTDKSTREHCDCSFERGVPNPKFWGRGGCRRSGMVPFKRALVSFYRLSIVTFLLSLRISEILPLLFSSMPLFPYPTSSLPRFPHVPLGIGGSPFGYKERRC